MTSRSLNKGQLPWPFRLISWLITIFMLLLVAAVTVGGAAVIGMTARYELNRTKSGDIAKIVEAKLPVGAPADRVVAVLDAEGIEHGAMEQFPGDDTDLSYAGVRNGTPIIRAIVRNEGNTVQLVDVKATFVFDE